MHIWLPPAEQHTFTTAQPCMAGTSPLAPQSALGGSKHTHMHRPTALPFTWSPLYPHACSEMLQLHAGNIFTEDDVSKWQRCLDLDLRASVLGIQLAARSMIKAHRPGAIIAVASAAGVFPMGAAPVYAAAKSGLVHFCKSAAAPLARRNVHIASVCPQFVDTALVANSPDQFRKNIEYLGKLMTPESIVEEILKLAQDPKRAGAAAVILQSGVRFDWDPPPMARKKSQAKAAGTGTTHAPRQQFFSPEPVPKTYTAWQVTKLTHIFAEAVELRTLDIPQVTSHTIPTSPGCSLLCTKIS